MSWTRWRLSLNHLLSNTGAGRSSATYTRAVSWRWGRPAGCVQVLLGRGKSETRTQFFQGVLPQRKEGRSWEVRWGQEFAQEGQGNEGYLELVPWLNLFLLWSPISFSMNSFSKTEKLSPILSFQALSNSTHPQMILSKKSANHSYSWHCLIWTHFSSYDIAFFHICFICILAEVFQSRFHL